MNRKVRETARSSGVRLWQIADHLGVSEAWMTRKLRHQLSPEDEKRILDIIDSIARERGSVDA